MSHVGLRDLRHRPGIGVGGVTPGLGRGGVSESQPETILASGPPSGRISVPQLPSSGSRRGVRTRAFRMTREPLQVPLFSLSDDGQIRDVRSGACRSCQTRLHPQDCERVAAGPQPAPAGEGTSARSGRARAPGSAESGLSLRAPRWRCCARAGGRGGWSGEAGWRRSTGFPSPGMKAFGGRVERSVSQHGGCARAAESGHSGHFEVVKLCWVNYIMQLKDNPRH